MTRTRTRQRMTSASALTAVGMFLLSASTSTSTTRTTDAFVLPKLRTRAAPHTVGVMSMTEDKTEKGKDVLKDGLLGKNGQKGAPLPIDLLNNGEPKEPEDSYEIHVGRALDTLRKDYPHILTDQPDFSIFDNQIEVIDPSGVKLHSLKSYKNAFRLMHAIVSVFYCPERSGLQYRICYDTARQNIRVSWNAEVIPKAIFGGVRTTLHVDGISVYEISRKSGMITQHRIERLVINDTPIRPQQGIFAMLRNEHDETVPVYNIIEPLYDDGYHQHSQKGNRSPPSGLFGNIVEFQQSQHSSLFCDAEDERSGTTSTSLAAISTDEESGDVNAEDYPDLDWEAFDRKNASRKKFGLSPLTPEEFMENEAQIKQMDTQRRQAQQTASSSAAAEMTKQSKSRQQGFLEKIFGNVLPESCESNYDCNRPEVCCDFGFKQICCTSGAFVGNAQYYEPAVVRVPIEVYPPGDERNYY